MPEKDLLTDLNPQQRQAVTHPSGPLLVVAGAGTGKTTVITRRIGWLVNQKLAKPSEILALTFTDKAAAEMETRVDVLVPYGYTDMWIQTFHAFGERILREHAIELGLPADFRVLSQVEQAIFLKHHLWELPLDYYRPLANPTKHIEAFIQLFSRLKDEEITPAELKDRLEKHHTQYPIPNTSPETEGIDATKWQELANLYATYTDLLRHNDRLDFGDLLLLAIQLFRTKPDIRHMYQRRFKYILVDEFQDTNHAQHELIKLLAGAAANITVVGDDDQAIYAFRGAALDNILEFRETYPRTTTIVLNQNYRSSQTILDASYSLIANNNPHRLEAKYGLAKKLTGRPGGKPPALIYEATGSEEVDQVIDIIRDRVAKGLKYRDIAILGRAHSHLATFEHGLTKAGIPVAGQDRGLYEQPDIRRLISFLKSVAYPTDSTAVAQLAGSDLYQIAPQVSASLNHLSKRRNRPIVRLLDDLPKLQTELEFDDTSLKELERVKNDLETFGTMAMNHNVGEVLYEYLRAHGVVQELSRQTTGNELRIRHLVSFFNRITRFIQLSTEQSVTAFVDNLNLLQEFGDDPKIAEPDPDLNAVHLLTVHAAKGLEFPVVFVVNCIADRFPSRAHRDAIEIPDFLLSPNSSATSNAAGELAGISGKSIAEDAEHGLRSQSESASERKTGPTAGLAESSFHEIAGSSDSSDHLAEERRLFYVALTRAKQELFITLAADYGGTRVRKPSPFVLEALNLPRLDPPVTKTTTQEQLSLFAPMFGKVTVSTPTITPQPLLSPAQNGPLTLTASKIEDYIDCPAKFKAIHLLHLPLVQSHAMVYGVAIHAAIQAHYLAKLRNEPTDYELLRTTFTKTWMSEGFLSREHEDHRYQAGLLTLRRFYEADQANPKDVLAVEESFHFPYPSAEGVSISGRYDAVYQVNGGVEITDFKTSNVTEAKAALKRAKDSLQLMLYAMAYQSVQNKLPEWVSLEFVESGMVGRYQPSAKEIDKAIKIIDDVIAGIRSGYFGKGKGSHSCEWCVG